MMTDSNLIKIGILGASIALPIGLQAGQREKSDRPNIVIILTDDMGYSDLGCYGGEIQTPNIDSLAHNGLRWTQFYNNARSCPSRAVLMTGLYPHQAGMGWMASVNMQSPGYQGYLNDNCVTIAEVLKKAGYGTYMAGKWHLCSDRQCKGDVTERWPVARGFEHYYGQLEGAMNYFHSRLVNNETKLPVTGDDFYLTDALSDTASAYIRRHDYSKKPLFLYLAFNAPHWPLHAHQEDIEKHLQTYHAGWDTLRAQRFRKQKELGLFDDSVEISPRDPKVPAWDSLSPKEQDEFAMRMSIYAAQIDALDRGIGKVVSALKKAGELDNTIIMIMDDNGACAEYIGHSGIENVTGKADTWESYRKNWANLSSTPYREYKHYTNEGGIASPLIVFWPNGIDKKYRGSFVREYGYFADIMATCIELAGTKYPKRYNGHKIIPCEGYSLVPNFSNKEVKREETFWEHEGNIAVRDGKWKLNIHHDEGEPLDLTKLELYDMAKDPTELHNIATKYPERAARMLEDWKVWAKKANVLPVTTQKSSERKRNYKLIINGDFDDNFGGWTLSQSSKASFDIDRARTISGGKTAKVTILNTEDETDRSFMKWPFSMTERAEGIISFTYRTDNSNSIMITAGNKNGGSTSKEYDLKRKGNISMPFSVEKGPCEIIFSFDGSEPGTIWIDDVKMDLRR